MNMSDVVESAVTMRLRRNGLKDTRSNRDDVLEDLRQEHRDSIVYSPEYRRAVSYAITQNSIDLDFDE